MCIEKKSQFGYLIEKNRREAFGHFVEIKKQDKNTVFVDGNIYSFKTKKGIVKKYIAFESWDEYKKSGLLFKANYKLEKVNGFIFVEVPQND